MDAQLPWSRGQNEQPSIQDVNHYPVNYADFYIIWRGDNAYSTASASYYQLPNSHINVSMTDIKT